MTVRIQVLKEVREKLSDGEYLCLQQVVYPISKEDGVTFSDIAFRFIRRDAKGHMKAQRGQAAIPDIDLIITLANKMELTRLILSNR